MTRFMVRVELHGARDDYDELHEEMAKRGLQRFVTAQDGRTFELPTGSYIGGGADLTTTAVKASAAEAAEATGHTFSVFVCSMGAWSGFGLEPHGLRAAKRTGSS